MREIKFRVYDKRLKSMHIVGTDSHDSLTCFDGIVEYYNLQNGEGSGESGDYILMQYTGLNDKNGKEIYEGDIIDFTYWWFDGNIAESHLIGEVVYLSEFMSYGLRGVKNADWIRHIGGDEGSTDTAPFATWTFDEADFEVIGNIYENPELLKGDAP